MVQPTDRGIARHRPAVQLRWREFLRHVLQLGQWHLAASDEPAPGLSEGDAHKPAAALAHAAREGHHRTERHQIPSEVVDRRYRIELRARRATGEQLALTAADTADRLHYRVEAAPRRPRPDVAEGAQRDEHDAGPELRQRLGRESAIAERARPVALGKNVRLADQTAQSLDV